MITKTIDMSVDYEKMGIPEPKTAPTLTAYLLDKEPRTLTMKPLRPAVIICPGGAYEFTYSGEGEPIAMRYAAAGFHSFVLNYSCKPTGWPAPTAEVSKAVKYVRSIADEYGIDKNKIIVCGFSAGGHLTASLGVYWNNPMIREYSGVTGEENKPNGLVLCYPVILDNPDESNETTINSFVGDKPENIEWFGLDKRVSETTPPTFLWHTVTDDGVPALSSLKFAAALYAKKVPFEMHLFPRGPHGLCLADDVTAVSEEQLIPEVSQWMKLSIDWIKGL